MVEVHPQNSSAVVGKEVQIHCTTMDEDDVHWEFLRNGSISRMPICIGSSVSDEVMDKYECTKEQTTHTLTVKNVVFNDSGIYTCIEDGGRGPGSDSSSLSVFSE